MPFAAGGAGCPACGRGGQVLYEGLRDRVCGTPGEYALRECGACELAWLEGDPPDAYAGDYYTHTIDAGVMRAQAVPTPAERAVLARTLGYPPVAAGARARALAWLPPWRERCQALAMYLPARPGGRLLDVGCGSGVGTARMRQLGWAAEGVEPDAVAAALARDVFGLAVTTGTLESAALEPAAYDAITLNHVIEHVADPAATLAHCAHLLRPGGRLVVTTPNLRSLGRRRFGRHWLHWDVPRHRVLFTPASLARLAAGVGLRPLQARTTARAAPWAWQRSRELERSERVSDAGRQQVRSAGAAAFALLESVAAARGPVGEEAVLLATV